MRIVTVSDAHLLNPEDPAYGDFLRFLDSDAVAAADVLVLNGDIFEFLVGRQRRALHQYAPVIDRLAGLATGRELVYIQGNHDFHLEGALPETIRVADRWEATVGGERTLWLHGDTVLSDPGYGLLRWLLRRQAVRLATETFPPGLTWHLATAWADSSRQLQGHTEAARVQGFMPRVEALLAKGYDRLVTGHLHFPLQHRTEAGAEWVALGDWMSERWYHVLTEAESELHRFSGK